MVGLAQTLLNKIVVYYSSHQIIPYSEIEIVWHRKEAWDLHLYPVVHYLGCRGQLYANWSAPM